MPSIRSHLDTRVLNKNICSRWHGAVACTFRAGANPLVGRLFRQTSLDQCPAIVLFLGYNILLQNAEALCCNLPPTVMHRPTDEKALRVENEPERKGPTGTFYFYPKQSGISDWVCCAGGDIFC